MKSIQTLDPGDVAPFAKNISSDTRSIPRFFEARIPNAALTNRDVNAEAPWEMGGVDFCCSARSFM